MHPASLERIQATSQTLVLKQKTFLTIWIKRWFRVLRCKFCSLAPCRFVSWFMIPIGFLAGCSWLDFPQAWWHRVPKWSASHARALPSWRRHGSAKSVGRVEMCSVPTWMRSWQVQRQLLCRDYAMSGVFPLILYSIVWHMAVGKRLLTPGDPNECLVVSV